MRSPVVAGIAVCLACSLVAPDAIAGSFVSNTLYIDWIGVIDNGEGDDWPHGPLGSLHATIWNSSGRKVASFVIHGPTSGEWLDGDAASYDGIEIGEVGLLPGMNGVRLQIWESDPGPWRSDDVLFDKWIGGGGMYVSNLAAHNDAVRNALNRGAAYWVRDYVGWNYGPNMPTMFIRVVEQ